MQKIFKMSHLQLIWYIISFICVTSLQMFLYFLAIFFPLSKQKTPWKNFMKFKLLLLTHILSVIFNKKISREKQSKHKKFPVLPLKLTELQNFENFRHFLEYDSKELFRTWNKLIHCKNRITALFILFSFPSNFLKVYIFTSRYLDIFYRNIVNIPYQVFFSLLKCCFFSEY